MSRHNQEIKLMNDYIITLRAQRDEAFALLRRVQEARVLAGYTIERDLDKFLNEASDE